MLFCHDDFRLPFETDFANVFAMDHVAQGRWELWNEEDSNKEWSRVLLFCFSVDSECNRKREVDCEKTFFDCSNVSEGACSCYVWFQSIAQLNETMRIVSEFEKNSALQRDMNSNLQFCFRIACEMEFDTNLCNKVCLMIYIKALFLKFEFAQFLMF